MAEQLISELLFLYRQGLPITTHDVRYSMKMIVEGRQASLHRMFAETILVTNRGRQIKAKTLGQWNYLETIRRNIDNHRHRTGWNGQNLFGGSDGC